ARLIGLESTLATQGAELAVAKADADKKASEALKLEGAFVAQTSGNAELETRLAKAQAEIVKKAAEHEKELEEQKFTREVLEGELAESQAGVKKQTGEIARLGDQLAKSILQVDALTTLQSELTEEQGKLQAGLLIAVARISALSQANAELEEQSIRKIQERDSQLTTAHAALSERDIKIESLAGELATITAVSQAQAEGFAAKDRSSQDLIQEQDDSIAGLQARLAAQRAEFDELLGDSERTHSEQISTLSSRASGSIDALQSERNRLELQLKEQGEALTKQLHEVKKSYEDQLGLLRADLASQDQRARESIAARDRTLALATEELAVARARAEQLEGAIGKLRADFAAEHHGLRNALDEADRQLALQSAGFQGAVQAHAAEIEKLHAGLAAAESGAVSERVAHAAALALAEVNAAADAARAGSALAALRAELAAAQQSNAASTSEVAALRAAAEAAGKQSAEELTRLRAAHAAEIARLKEELAELAERAVSDVAVQTTITPLRDARAVAVQTEALLAAGVAPAFPPAAPVLRSDDDAAGPAVLTAAEPVQEAPAGHTADGDWVKCETYDSTKSEFFIKDARAEVRSISHTSHKQELALEVFLSMYIAGCRQGMTPTVFASGSDPELVALFYVYAEFFKAAGMPIEVTGTPSGEAQGLAAAKVRIKQYICGDTAATLSDKEVGRKIVDLFLSSKSSASGDLDAFLGRMGFSNESAIRAKRAEISTDKSIYWAARKSDTEQLKKFEAFGAGLKVLSDALDRQVGSDSDPVKAITESLKQTVDAPRVVPGRS
ncbi:MAG: hypothetical protein KBD64_07835, partial [Gammaproteobacteria bacterium]|nr:hypothetical protein [Gammaproteobacteria bacterium]